MKTLSQLFCMGVTVLIGSSTLYAQNSKTRGITLTGSIQENQRSHRRHRQFDWSQPRAPFTYSFQGSFSQCTLAANQLFAASESRINGFMASQGLDHGPSPSEVLDRRQMNRWNEQFERGVHDPLRLLLNNVGDYCARHPSATISELQAAMNELFRYTENKLITVMVGLSTQLNQRAHELEGAVESEDSDNSEEETGLNAHALSLEEPSDEE